MKTTFYLARHGQTEWNVIKRLQGRLDSPLTAAGKQQAMTLATELQNHHINQIYSSPLPRAHNSALLCQQQLAQLGQNITLTIDSQLIERDFGHWQGELFDDVRHQSHFEDIFFRVSEYAPPQGETGIACANRMSKALKNIAKQTSEPQKLLVITHGDVLRCFCHELNQQAFCDAYSQYGNATLFMVDFDHQTQTFSQI